MCVCVCVLREQGINVCYTPASLGGASTYPIHSHLCNLADRMAEFLQAGFPATLDALGGGGLGNSHGVTLGLGVPPGQLCPLHPWTFPPQVRPHRRPRPVPQALATPESATPAARRDRRS